MPHPSQTIVLTGATSGLGRIVASALVCPGSRLVLVARNKDKAEQTRQELLRECPGSDVDCVLADFTSLDSVAEAGAEIASRYPQINTLINNAGIHAFEQRITRDGFPEMVSTNYLAPWLLTAYARPSLLAAGASRVVTVGSEASRRSGGLSVERDLTDCRPFSWLGSSVVYGRTKLMSIMFSAQLARTFASTEVVSNCVDPGFNVTGLGRELPCGGAIEKMLLKAGIGSPHRGAEGIFRLANDGAHATRNGMYFSREIKPLKVCPPGDELLQQVLLWTTTAQLLQPFYRPAHELTAAF